MFPLNGLINKMQFLKDMIHLAARQYTWATNPLCVGNTAYSVLRYFMVILKCVCVCVPYPLSLGVSELLLEVAQCHLHRVQIQLSVFSNRSSWRRSRYMITS